MCVMASDVFQCAVQRSVHCFDADQVPLFPAHQVVLDQWLRVYHSLLSTIGR